MVHKRHQQAGISNAFDLFALTVKNLSTGFARGFWWSFYRLIFLFGSSASSRTSESATFKWHQVCQDHQDPANSCGRVPQKGRQRQATRLKKDLAQRACDEARHERAGVPNACEEQKVYCYCLKKTKRAAGEERTSERTMLETQPSGRGGDRQKQTLSSKSTLGDHADKTRREI